MTKLWNGRFGMESDKLADKFNCSLDVDKKLYLEDINGSIAHAKMLGNTNIISNSDAIQIVTGLEDILKEIKDGTLIIQDAEDIHMFVEETLTKKIGAIGKRLHTARSRNDQVVTDFKLYIKKATINTATLLCSLTDTLYRLAKKNTNTVMPGFTHLQKAQPITLAHHFSCYIEMFMRDINRLLSNLERIDFCPLGSGALAGTTYPIDRSFVAKELGFGNITNNSMDGVSDRDYVLDYLYTALTSSIHLSRLSEEYIMWASNEYRFIEISDAYATGSSIMPQKKNPDMAELVRGKTGKMLGNLVSMATILKGLPLAYNKDLQEDKSLLLDTETNLNDSITIFDRMLQTTTFNKAVMEKSAKAGFTNATDLADYLVKKGLPFRDAHAVSGKLVAYCISSNLVLEDMSLTELKKFNTLFESDVYQAINLLTVVNTRNSAGGTSPSSVKVSLSIAARRLSKMKKKLRKH